MRESDKINIQMSVISLEGLYYLLSVVKECSPLNRNDATKKVFPEARAKIGKWDAKKKDTHTELTLNEMGLIEYTSEDAFVVSRKGMSFLNAFELKLEPKGRKFEPRLICNLMEPERRKLIIDLLDGTHVRNAKYNRDIHPYRILFNAMKDDRLGGYVTNWEWQNFLASKTSRQDSQYEVFIEGMMKARSEKRKGRFKRLDRTLTRLIDWGVVSRKGIGHDAKFFIKDEFKEFIRPIEMVGVGVEIIDEQMVENLFESWLQKLPSYRGGDKITARAAEHYALKLRVPFTKAGFKHIEPKNLFKIVDIESFLTIKQMIVGSEIYEKENSDGYLAKALSYYGDFLTAHRGLILKKVACDSMRSISEAGLTYDSSLVRRFQAALLSKPFVVLTGLSGSGKTKLAEAFVRWLCGNPGQTNNWKLVSVGADWTNSEKLLGYPDALHEGKYIMPDTGVLQFLLRAKKAEEEGKGIPYFLILDEMNLSHVERYFADFLSAMESVDGVVRLHDSKKIEDDSNVPREFALPRNLFVIGTMNVDETTYMFSPKVLDRAQVIEFRVDKNAMDKYLDGSDNLDLNKLCDDDGKGRGASYASAFLAARKKDYSPVAEAKNALAEFFPILEKLGSEFGFRTASEFRRFASIYVSAGGDPLDAVDFAIMQKLLPKLHGSKRKLSAPLKALWNLCQTDGTEKDMPSIEKEEEFDFGKECRYPVSAKKILRMVRALEVGFASFAEA